MTAGTTVPSIFIAGAPRCGTTSLYEALRQHPAIFMCDPKEPHHLCPDLDSGSYLDSLYFMRSRADYLALFAAAREGQMTGEASTSYLLSTTAAGLIQALNPHARILIMLRHPVDMIESFHARRVFSGAEDLTDLTEALAAEDDRRAGRRIPKSARNAPALQYRALAHYAGQVERYQQCFPQDQLRVIIFEELRTNPEAAYRDAYRFLDVDENFQPILAAENAARQVRRRRLHRLLASPRLIAAGRRVVPAALMRRVRPFLSRATATPGGYARLSTTDRARLREELLPDIRRLSQLLGRDFEELWP